MLFNVPDDRLYVESMRDGIQCVKAAYGADKDGDWQKAMILYESATFLVPATTITSVFVGFSLKPTELT